MFRKTWQSLQARPTAAAGTVAIGTFSWHVQGANDVRCLIHSKKKNVRCLVGGTPGPTTPTSGCCFQEQPLIGMRFGGFIISKKSTGCSYPLLGCALVALYFCDSGIILVYILMFHSYYYYILLYILFQVYIILRLFGWTSETLFVKQDVPDVGF